MSKLLTVRMTDEQHAALKTLAPKKQRTMAALIKEALHAVFLSFPDDQGSSSKTTLSARLSRVERRTERLVEAARQRGWLKNSKA